MSWNYRIVERESEKETWFEVVEAYYDENGKVNGFTDTRETPVRHIGDTAEELIKVYEMILKDLKKSKEDVLDENMFDGKYWNDDLDENDIGEEGC